MESALNFAGYQVNHAWGDGGHDTRQADAIFPDVVRWLWRGWPAAVPVGTSANDMLSTLLMPGQGWQLISMPQPITGRLTATPDGTVVVSTLAGIRYQLSANDTATGWSKYSISVTHTNKHYPLLSDPTKLTDPWGRTYQALPGGRDGQGSIVLTLPNGLRRVVDRGPFVGEALALSPDKKRLYAGEKNANWISSYVVGADGTLLHRQRWYWLHNIDNDTRHVIRSVAVDQLGNLYVATALGVQVCDQNGRVRAILRAGEGAITSVCFGGTGFNTLFIVSDGQLFRRSLRVHGVPAWAAPVVMPSQGEG